MKKKIFQKKHIPYALHCIDDSDIKAVIKVLKSRFLTQGPLVSIFEKMVADYCGARYAVSVNSGTSALHIACLAAGVQKSDKVITSPITFVASSNCILYCGGKPIFSDINKNTGNIDPELIKNKINSTIKAIIPVHYGGQPYDVEKIYNFAKNQKFIIIEDACHAFGAEYKYKTKWFKVGSCAHSDMAVFSFHPAKHITTGEGGMVLTNNKYYYDRLLMFRNHGITKDAAKFLSPNSEPWEYEMQFLGYNYRITDFQCALGISQLKKIKKFIRRRRKIAELYDREFSGTPNMEVVTISKNTRSAYHLYVIKIKNKLKKDVYEELRKNKIFAQVHYKPVYLQPYYQRLGYKKGECPFAEDFYREVLSIPMYPELKNKEIYRITSIIKNILYR